MVYCAIDDIKKIINAVLLQLSDDTDSAIVSAEMLDVAVAGGDLTGYTEAEQAAVAVVMANIVEAIDNADSMIDGYAASRYLTPFNPVPRLIHVISIDIAIYNLYSRRENVPEIREKRYKDAVRLLDRLADGKLTIGEVDKPVVESSGVIKSVTRPKLFGRDTLDNY